jgi:thiol-disulfide isomerase/thioredoxin
MVMKSFILAGLAAVVVASSACSREAQPAEVSSVAEIKLPVLGKAPVWTLKDVDGREVKSADFKGKVVVVDFWATWCPPCRKEIPEYVAMQKKYADKGLMIVGISLDEAPAADVKRFGEGMKINYPLVMGDAETVDAFGGVEGLPTAFVIDREGNVRHVKLGLADPAAYEKLIVSLL